MLFPFAGKLVDETLTLTGTKMKQHGFARNRAWTVTSAMRPLTMTLAADAETRAQFPFEFTAHHRVMIVAGGIQLELAIIAGDRDVPVSPGWHPYFTIARAKKAAVRPGDDRRRSRVRLRHRRTGRRSLAVRAAGHRARGVDRICATSRCGRSPASRSCASSRSSARPARSTPSSAAGSARGRRARSGNQIEFVCRPPASRRPHGYEVDCRGLLVVTGAASAGTVTGRVVENGFRVAEYAVALDGRDPTPVQDPDGRFVLADVSPGRHRIAIMGWPFRKLWVDVDAAAKPVDIGTIVVEPGRQVTGRVVDVVGNR